MTGAEKQKAYRDREREKKITAALPWPMNRNKAARWGNGVVRYVPPTKEEQEAMMEATPIVLTHENRVFTRKCVLPECGKEFETDLLLMRFCCREHQMERLRQLDTRNPS